MRRALLSGLAALALLLLAMGGAWAQAVQPGAAQPEVCVYSATLPTLASGQMGLLQCDANGRILTSGSGSGGGGAVTQGTSPWVDNITQWASVALGAPTNYGTAPTGVVPGVNAFVTNFPATQAVSWTGQTVGITGTVSANNAQWGGTNVAPATAYGTAPTGNVPGTNAFVTNFPATQAVSWSNQTVAATQSGAWNTNLYVAGAANASGNPAFVQVTNFPATQTITGTVNQGTAAAIASAWPTYLSQGGAVLSSTNGLPTTDTNESQTITSPGTSATKAQAVQGVSGGTAMPVSAASLPLPTGAATAASQPTAAASASTSSGQTGTLAMGAATTTAPTLTTAQTYPLSLTLAGALRVDGSAVTQPVSATTLPLPTGAATAANQNVTAAGTSATAAQAMQGVTGGIPVPVSQGSGLWNTGSNGTATAGGITTFSRLTSSAATTNLTNAKTSAGRLYKIVACNTTTTPYRIKLYNAASTGAVTVGTTVPQFTRPVPAAAASGGLACATYDAADIGWYFSTGITWATTLNAADTDTAALAAGQGTDISLEYQ